VAPDIAQIGDECVHVGGFAVQFGHGGIPSLLQGILPGIHPRELVTLRSVDIYAM
jgi:hypothetical protein